MSDVLEVRNVCKKLDNDMILDGINFNLRQGEIHLIWGENGAGKSVLMRVLCGMLTFDNGEITILGKTYKSQTPAPGKSSSIAMLPQENGLIEELSVFENLFINHSFGFIRMETYFDAHIPDFCRSFATCLRPILDRKVRTINNAQYQVLQIIKTILFNKPILVFDEPLSFLNNYERHIFCDILRHLQQNGHSVIMITHHADRMMDIGDRISIIKNGKVIHTASRDAYSSDALISSFAESQTLSAFPKLRPLPKDLLLEVDHLSGSGLDHVSFHARKGEIIGFTGSVSSGKNELPSLFLGIRKKHLGRIIINGEKIMNHTPDEIIRRGVSYLPANHNNSGVFITKDIAFNIAGVSPQENYFSSGELIANHYINKLRIKARSAHDPIRHLSCGNRKKVLLSRALVNEAQLYIFDEPTSGVDQAGRSELYNIMNHLVIKGASIILISSNFAELSAMCDRIYFMQNGRISGVIDHADANPEMLYKLCAQEEEVPAAPPFIN